MQKTYYKLLVCLMIFLCLIIIPTSFAADADASLIDENTNSLDSLGLVESVDDGGSLDSLNTEDEILGVSESNGDVLEADYYFDSSAETDGNGTIGNPYNILKYNRINSNSVIHLANGVYNLTYQRTVTNLTIIGQDAAQTIINGNKMRFEVKGTFILQNVTLNDFRLVNNAKLNATNVIFQNGAGFYISGGIAGGAIYAPSNSPIYLRNCTFYNNSVAKSGGAIYSNAHKTIEIIDCTFINNTAGECGGAIYINTTSQENKTNLTIKNTKFINDKSTGDAGGAIYLRFVNFNGNNISVSNCSSTFGGAFTILSSDVVLTNIYGFNNTAMYDGGFIYQMYGELKVSNSTFISNNAKNGAGIFIDGAKRLSIYNNTFINNSASVSAGAIYSVFNNNSNIKDIIYENNTALDPLFNDLFNSSYLDLIAYGDDYSLYNYNIQDNPLESFYNSSYVTSIKNQGNGGNCWAFATLATLESCILKASGENLDLSEENMKNLAALYSVYGWNYEPNGGGFDDLALGYLASWLGPVFESEDSYNAQSALSPVLNSFMHVQNVLFLKRDNYTDNDMIKRAIMDYGAVYSPVYMDYKSDDIGYYVYNALTKRDHAVTLIGWDDTVEIPGAPGKGAWIVKNSWSSVKYFYLSYYDMSSLQLGKWGDAFTFILNDTIKFDKNYQYDIAKTDFFFNTTKTAWYKNIFNATDNEYLTAVSTYFEKETTYRLSVNVNNVSILNQSGFARPGYWTIDLLNPISLNVGDIFEIVFKINVTGDAGVPISEAQSLNNKFYKENISFISFDGKNWVDLYDLVWKDYPDHTYKSQVACIKAFTLLNKVNTEITLDVNPNVTGENNFNPVNIIATVLNQYGYPVNCGQVKFNLANEIVYANVSNGVAQITHIFKKGINNISAEFVSCAYNSPIVNSTVDITKYDVSMSLDDFSLIFDNATVNVSFSEPINETVFFIFDYRNFTAKAQNGKASVNLTDLNAGWNNLKIALYPAIYDCNEILYAFKIDEYDTRIIVEDSSTIYNKDYKYKIKLVDLNGNPLSGRKIEYRLNNVNYSGTTDNNGEITLSNLKAGTYKLIASFKGENLYHESSNSSTITIKTTVALPSYSNYTYGSKYSVKFLDKNLNPLKNTNVTIVFGGKTYKLKTDSNGIVKIDNYLKPGTYDVIFKNPKTLEEKTHKIKVLARISSNNDLTMYYGAGSYYKVRVYDNYGRIAQNVSVKFSINGKNYYRTTDKNGYASLKITLNPKVYTISATYNGFTVKNKVTVKPTVITKNLSKKKARIIKFTAKLVNSKGVILKYKYVTFKFKGKKYLRKTNKYGIATIGLKNLRRVKYTIYSSYGKLTVKNTIKVY